MNVYNLNKYPLRYYQSGNRCNQELKTSIITRLCDKKPEKEGCHVESTY